MNLVLVVFCKLCYISIARVVASLCFCFPMFLYVFLEKTMLKTVSSNDADLVRDLRFILIAGQKNCVLDALLGDRPITGADADIMNVFDKSSV